VNTKNTKTIGKHGEVVEKTLYKCTSEGMMHVAAWYHGTPGPKFTNVWNKFRLVRPLTLPIFVALTKSVRGIRCRKILLPGKVGQSSPYRSPDFSPIDRPYASFYRHSVTLALDCFVSEISLVLYPKCHFCTYPSSFIRNLEMSP